MSQKEQIPRDSKDQDEDQPEDLSKESSGTDEEDAPTSEVDGHEPQVCVD